MRTPRNKYHILNYIFVACLLILILNDHYLKYEYGNWITGKLSDCVGIIMLPLLITYLIPAVKEKSILISAILFAFWKSPFSQNLIDLYNQHSFIQTSRVIDYTDLFVIMLLPLPYLLIKRSDLLNPFKINKVHPMIMLLPTAFSLMATSPPRAYYYTRTDGNLRCYKCHFTVNYNQDEILALLKKVDIVLDTTAPACLDYEDRLYLLPYLKTQNTRYYKLNMLVIDKDTLRDIDFTLRTIKNKKTKIYFNGMNVPDDVSTWKLESKARKFYRRLLFEALKSKLED